MQLSQGQRRILGARASARLLLGALVFAVIVGIGACADRDLAGPDVADPGLTGQDSVAGRATAEDSSPPPLLPLSSAPSAGDGQSADGGSAYGQRVSSAPNGSVTSEQPIDLGQPGFPGFLPGLAPLSGALDCDLNDPFSSCQ